MNKKEEKRISYKITINMLTTISILLFISISIITILLNSFYNNQKTYLENKLSRLFISLILPAMERYDYYSIEKSCQEFLSEEIVGYIYIYDNNGFLVNQSFMKNKKFSSFIDEFRFDILNSENITIGYAKIGYDYKSYYFSLFKVKMILFINILSILIFITLITYIIISKNLSLPLLELLNSINKISAGDYGHKLKVYSDDEIGQISMAFNEMTSKLSGAMSLINGIIDNLPGAVIFIDRNFKVNLWNRSAEKFFDIDFSSVYQKTIYDIDPYFIELEEDILNVFQTYSIKILRQKHIENNRFKDKYHTISLIPLLSDIPKSSGEEKNRITDNNNRLQGIIIKIDDETENVKNANIMTQIQKMESIQVLGSGIAHDFNNILAGISGTIILLDNEIKNEEINKEDLKEYVEILKLSTQKASLIVNQLMSFSKKKSLQFTRVNLVESIENIIRICKYSFDKSVEIKYKPEISDAFIWGNESQIEQVLLNLCINAYHAMTIMKKESETKGGILNLSLKMDIKENKNYWSISIKDNGVGIPRENIKKIFDPFFSTKDKTTSSGLGLALVYNIVESHNGFIELESEVGKGTEMKIFLPVYEDEIQNDNINKINGSYDLNFSGKKVLIVDDEDLVRKVLVRLFKKYNFLIYEIGDPGKCLQIFERECEQFDLIILDLIMPKISGYELFIMLEEKYGIVEKNVPVIMTTGLSLDERVEKLKNYKNVNILPKPYNMEDINKILYKIFLDR
ncbi:MAG: ATP-binding protein [Exilispira sp.]